MLLGSINFNKKEIKPDERWYSILNALEWTKSASIPISNDFFCGQIIYNPQFAKAESEYFFIDTHKEVMVFLEGEIYNSKEIAEKLGLSKVGLKIPELVYTAFLECGPDFANHLNGDFAICIFQTKKQEILFFRDHLGIRPLAVSEIDGTVYFATDPMGLSKALYGNEKIDFKYLLSYFSEVENPDSTLAPNKNLLKIKAGQYLIVSTSQVIQKKYWFPEHIKTDHSLTQQQVISDLNALVRDTVNIRVDKDRFASAHLSGGLDSSTVAAFARKEYKHQSDFYGFSWTPDAKINAEGVSHNERIFVKKTAQLNNIEPVFSSINLEDYSNFIKDWRHPSEMMYEHQTVQTAKERGVNLIFSGWGGDEFISIGNRGVDPDLIRQFDWKYFLKKYPIRKPRNLLRALIYSALFPSIRRTYSKYKSGNAIYPYIKKWIGSNVIAKKERFKYNSRRRVHLQLLEMGHLGARTSDWYVHGQRNAMAYRYPLLDKRIIEYMLTVPSRCLVGNNHYRILLREIGKEVLSEEVLKNKSKDDPILSQQFYKFVKKVKRQLISEFDDFRQNPDLAFVDFDLLEKNIPAIQDNIEQGKEEDGTAIFYCLKAAHEFTKGYYN